MQNKFWKNEDVSSEYKVVPKILTKNLCNKCNQVVLGKGNLLIYILEAPYPKMYQKDPVI